MIPLGSSLVLISMSLELREIVNGALFVLSFNLAGLIAWFMLRTWREVGHGWQYQPGMPTACVLSWVFTIVGVRSLVTWFSLHEMTAGRLISEAIEMTASASFIIAAGILIAVTLRATYLFTPPEWHHRAWTLSAFAAICFVVLSEIWS